MQNHRDTLPFSLIDVFVISNSSFLFPLYSYEIFSGALSSFGRVVLLPHDQDHRCPRTSFSSQHGINRLYMIIRIVKVEEH